MLTRLAYNAIHCRFIWSNVLSQLKFTNYDQKDQMALWKADRNKERTVQFVSRREQSKACINRTEVKKMIHRTSVVFFFSHALWTMPITT